MGQYYKVLLKKGRKIRTAESLGWLKLMESSYITNPLTDYVFKELYENGPHRVAWLGDYAHGDYDAFGGLTHEEYMKEYKAAYKTKALNIDLLSDAKISIPEEKLKTMAIVNHTKKIFLDFNDYIAKSKKSSEWIINPLALLTACGNGRGGGDYFGTDMELVGTWAFDEIEIKDMPDVPADYEKTDVSFRESRG